MQHPGTNLLASPSHPRTIHASASLPMRLDLPSRNVTADTIEEAFIQFILSCNPGVPLDTDTAALQEAFKTPPKSGGKSFSTWALFELIVQFQNKEIKTWGELALKLGVEPPDQDKGQSSQKIQQYAVRLKRWMHSMHVDAFFEYLLENPHPYWTEIPLDPNPISEGGRDGVAAEDDMALRSLLPHIRPRRGRKRPDDERTSRSPSQKSRMEAGSDQNNSNASGPGIDQQQLDLWATADARSGPYLFEQDQFTRMNMNLANPGSWAGEDFAQTPMTAHPYPAVVPATASAYWAEQPGDMKPGMTATKSKTNRRHGAKVVSSAWRSGGPGGSGKTRGRPPLNRQTSQTHSQGEAAAASSFSAFPSLQSTSPSKTFRHASLHHSPQMMDASLHQHPIMTLEMDNPATTITSSPHPQQRMGSLQQGYDLTGQNKAEAPSRSLRTKRSRLSLQVPERAGAEVKLATPGQQQQQQQQQQQVPAVMINGAMTAAGDQASTMAHHHQHQQSMNVNMAGSDMHMMDPFVSAAAQSMYDMQYQQQQAHQQQQHQHQHHQEQQQHHQHPKQIQHAPQASQDPASLYSTAPISTHDTAATNQPQSSPPINLFHQPVPPASLASTATRTAGNRTNLDALEALLMCELLGAAWTDAQGRRIAACGVDEAMAVAREVIERVRREAGSAQGFLLNMAALAGVTRVKADDGRVRVQRMGAVGQQEEEEEGGGGGGREVYEVHWELQLGDVRSGFSLREVVGREAWATQKEQGQEDAEGEAEGADEDEEGGEDGGEGGAARWRERYRGLLGVVQAQTAELSGLREGVVALCRPRSSRREGEDGESAG